MPEPIDLFISYSHKDADLCDELKTHLTLLKRQGLVRLWHDGDIQAGSTWNNEIHKNLESARIILLLVSANFLASDFIHEVELKRALERHDEGSARVIPIIVKACDWTAAPFAALQALPRDGKAVATYRDRDAAWTEVARALRGILEMAPAAGP